MDDEREISFIGIDIGGTFTDAAFFAGDRLWIMKTPTTVDDPARGALELARQLNGEKFVLNHGSTLATNAVLERRGEPTAFITTRGFRDMLQIARQNRPHLYKLEMEPREPIVSRENCFEVAERVDRVGDVLRRVNREELLEVLKEAADTGARSLAVCLLFSFNNPKNEEIIADAANGLFDFISISSQVLPEYREYERASTTVLNAYVSPILGRYVQRLGDELEKMGAVDFKIMESGGGILPAREASSLGVRTILSGPAGGVAGAFHVAKGAGFDNIITLDMGGTSTDVSLCNGGIGETREGQIDGFPVRVPMVDIETIGAGGGSIARVDPGGVLKVGPRSAGADPGPAAYGMGFEATVTDAHLVLGTISENDFLGGGFTVSRERSIQAVEIIARKMGSTLTEAACGILQVTLSHMERALRVVSLERGFDPGRFTLVPFGGAGPVHGPFLAENLGIDRILIPRYPGVLSALGMLLCNFRMDFIQTVLIELDNLDEAYFKKVVEGIYHRADRFLKGNYFDRAQVEYSLDVRYRGQSFEINVKLDRRECPAGIDSLDLPTVPAPDLAAARRGFQSLHKKRFGFAREDEVIEVVNVRLNLVGETPRPEIIPENQVKEEAPESTGEPRLLTLPDGTEITAPVFQRDDLYPGNLLPAPSVVVQYDTVTIIPPGWSARVDRFENLLMEREK